MNISHTMNDLRFRFICHQHEYKILFITQLSLNTNFDLLYISQPEFFVVLLFDVINLIVTSSTTSQFEEAWDFCNTYFHFIKDIKFLLEQPRWQKKY